MHITQLLQLECPAFDYANVYSTRTSNSFTSTLQALFASFAHTHVNTALVCVSDSVKRPTSRAYTRSDVAHLGQTRTGAGLHRVVRRVTQPYAYAAVVRETHRRKKREPQRGAVRRRFFGIINRNAARSRSLGRAWERAKRDKIGRFVPRN